MTTKITYDGYLTEAKLGGILRSLFGPENVKSNVRLEPSRYRIDHVVTYKGVEWGFEFDGPTHYTSASVIVTDGVKDALFSKAQNRAVLIRIPYFVQFDQMYYDECLAQFFGPRPDTFDVKFPHGFHDSKVIYPVDYNRMGMKRFAGELHSMFANFWAMDATEFAEHDDPSSIVCRIVGSIIEAPKDFCRYYPEHDSNSFSRTTSFTVSDEKGSQEFIVADNPYAAARKSSFKGELIVKAGNYLNASDSDDEFVYDGFSEINYERVDSAQLRDFALILIRADGEEVEGVMGDRRSAKDAAVKMVYDMNLRAPFKMVSLDKLSPSQRKQALRLTGERGYIT